MGVFVSWKDGISEADPKLECQLRTEEVCQRRSRKKREILQYTECMQDWIKLKCITKLIYLKEGVEDIPAG